MVCPRAIRFLRGYCDETKPRVECLETGFRRLLRVEPAESEESRSVGQQKQETRQNATAESPHPPPVIRGFLCSSETPRLRRCPLRFVSSPPFQRWAFTNPAPPVEPSVPPKLPRPDPKVPRSVSKVPRSVLSTLSTLSTLTTRRARKPPRAAPRPVIVRGCVPEVPPTRGKILAPKRGVLVAFSKIQLGARIAEA